MEEIFENIIIFFFRKKTLKLSFPNVSRGHRGALPNFESFPIGRPMALKEDFELYQDPLKRFQSSIRSYIIDDPTEIMTS